MNRSVPQASQEVASKVEERFTKNVVRCPFGLNEGVPAPQLVPTVEAEAQTARSTGFAGRRRSIGRRGTPAISVVKCRTGMH